MNEPIKMIESTDQAFSNPGDFYIKPNVKLGDILWVALPSSKPNAMGNFFPFRIFLKSGEVSIGSPWNEDYSQPTVHGEITTDHWCGYITNGTLIQSG